MYFYFSKCVYISDKFSSIAVAFAEIDWHDYAIVQTIEFTAADATSELPPPMSVQEVENMTLAQKRMAAMIMETTAEDVEAHRARQAAAEAEAAAAVGGAGGAEEEETVMEESDDEDQEAEERQRREEEERRKEVERARAIQASSLDAGGPIKIRTDYVPKRECSFALCNDMADLIITISTSGQEGHGKDDDLRCLWTGDSSGRAARAYAYRTSRPQVEGEARCSGGPQSPGFGAATRCERRIIFEEPSPYSCRYLRRRGGRREAEKGRGGGEAAEKGEGEGRLGWPYSFQSKHSRQVLNQRQLRRADCCDPSCKGSRTVSQL